MAVTLTVTQLVAALRLSDSSEELAEVTRLLAYASDAVVAHVPNAPDTAHNEAVRRLVGYLYDQPEAARGDAYANSMRNSGAARMLLPYRVHRAGYADNVAEAQRAVGSTDNPVVDVRISGTTLTVTFSDGQTETFTLPSGGGGGGGADQTARDAAAMALIAANDAQADADTNTAALADKLERSDVSPGIGINISPTVGSTTQFTISATGGDTGPEVLAGTWRFSFLQPAQGEVHYSGDALIGEIDTWLFNATGNTTAQAELLGLASGDMVEIRQNGNRHQTITLTETPTASGTIVTVTGRGDRGLANQIPGAFATVTVTLVPGPIQGVDQTARAAADAAQTDVDNHEASTHNTDATARAAASTAQTDIDAHEANHPAGGGGDAAEWSWLGQVTGAFTANTTRDLGLQPFPQLGYANYAALQAAVTSGAVSQVAIRLSQTDPGGSDDDGAVFIIPNVIGFYHGGAGNFRAFPAWNLGVDPVKCDVSFGASAVTVTFDADVAATPLVIVRVGVFK